MTAPGNPQRRWTPDEDAALRALYPQHSCREAARALDRTLASIKNRAHTLGLQKGHNPGCFLPGEQPWNKGAHFTAGGRSAETRFKPGNKPHGWNPVGHMRVTRDGIVQRKCTDTGRTQRDYVGIHHLVWRMHGGQIPPGHALVFRDGDRRNFDINNLELLSRKQLMQRNTVHRYPKEVAQLVQLRSALTRQINKRKSA